MLWGRTVPTDLGARVLASDVVEGRVVGSPGKREALPLVLAKWGSCHPGRELSEALGGACFGVA